MIKKILFTCLLFVSSFVAQAQYDLTITYDVNSGTSTLQSAAKVYMHSGGNDVAGPLDISSWHYIIGNWGFDDGIGEMTFLFGQTWTITIDPLAFYSTGPSGPVTGPEILRLGMVFRDETGSATGKDNADSSIYMDLSTGIPSAYNTDGTPFNGVTAGISAGVHSLSVDKLGIYNSPNPVTSHTVFSYYINENSRVKLSIFDATGRLVNTLFNEVQSNGKHYYNWLGEDNNGNLLSGGIYYYSLNSSTDKVNGKLIIVR